jgi:hypothetical protein
MNEIRGWAATGRRAIRVLRQQWPARERAVGMVLGIGALVGAAALTPHHPLVARQAPGPWLRSASETRWHKPHHDFRAEGKFVRPMRPERPLRPARPEKPVPPAPPAPQLPSEPPVQPVQPAQPGQPAQPAPEAVQAPAPPPAPLGE